MPTKILNTRQDQPWFRRLYLPTYKVRDAARYAGTSPQSVANWHYRGDPVLTGRIRKRPLNYLQLVEVAFVAFFRNNGVNMHRIRKTINYLKQNFGNENPLVEYEFKTEGMHILMEYNEFDPDPNFEKLVVTDRFGQLAWSNMLEGKFAEFDYEYELALRWHPAGRDSLVIIDPRIAFGAPMVCGLPTWVLKGRWNAHETPNEIRDEFGLSEQAVRDGLAFEGIKLNGDFVLG
jgi:uncharacterized protein (DUF433 family)